MLQINWKKNEKKYINERTEKYDKNQRKVKVLQVNYPKKLKDQDKSEKKRQKTIKNVKVELEMN